MSGGGTSDFTIQNDVALLELNFGFDSFHNFPPGVGTICLPTQRMLNRKVVTVLGWGGINVNQDQSPMLKEVWMLWDICNALGLCHTGSVQSGK